MDALIAFLGGVLVGVAVGLVVAVLIIGMDDWHRRGPP